MATTMDIRLNYGTWPGDGGDTTTESAISRGPSPPFYHNSHADEIQQDTNARRQQSSSTLSLSDLFSDSGDDSHPLDRLHPNMYTPSANTSHNTYHPPNPSWHSQGTDALNLSFTQPSAYESSVIDLTDSPPQPLHRPGATPSRVAPLPVPEEHSVMPATLRSGVSSRRALPAASSPSASYAGEGPRKRRRLSERSSGAERRPRVTKDQVDVEAVDLTEVNDESDLSKAISKQQQDAVQAQKKDNEGDQPPGRTPLSSYKCPICMDTPEDATSTLCGHLFCHKCIIDTLRFSEQQRRDDAGISKAKGTCPVCRKPLARKDEPGAGRTLVPLEIKLSTRRDLKGKGVVSRNGQTSAIPGRMLAKTERESSADMWRDLTTLDHN